MKYTFRKNRDLTYDEQISAMEVDRRRSREHPNSILNDERQRNHARAQRELHDWQTRCFREARKNRRFIKKMARILGEAMSGA